MLESVESLTGSARTRQLLLATVAACVFAWLYTYVVSQIDVSSSLRTGLMSDLNAYARLTDQVLDGGWPYFDVVVEHLPISTAALLVLVSFSSWSGIALWVVWPVAMAALVVLTAHTVDRWPGTQGSGFTFVVVAAPMLPLVLFRLDPIVVVLAAIAIGAFVGGRMVIGTVSTITGVLAKGWPGIAVLEPWRSGRRGVAVGTALGSMALLAPVVLSGGFRAGREFSGIHTETLVGSSLLLLRQLTGSDLGLVPAAGALYIDAPAWTPYVNAIPGVIVIGVGVWLAVRRPHRPIIEPLGIVTLGIVLASPLASTQFVYWFAPFVAVAATGTRRRYLLVGVLALASITFYYPASVPWALLVFGRNVVLVVLALRWILGAEAHRADPPRNGQGRTSRRNLPV